MLTGVKPEQTNRSAAVSAANALYTLSFVDVAANLKLAQLENPIRLQADTFDGWNYAMLIAPKPGDDSQIYFTFDVTGEAKKTERVPAKDEKPDEKEKRDKAHEERFKRLEAQLAREKSFAGRVFLVEKKGLAPLLRERSRFIEEPEKPAAAKK